MYYHSNNIPLTPGFTPLFENLSRNDSGNAAGCPHAAGSHIDLEPRNHSRE